MGRRKIEMRMVKDNGTRQVTFSKRRNGVFKKANELATLCAADVAVVVFSPGGRPYSYGNPSVHAVADQFLGLEGKSDDETENPNPGRANRREEARRKAKIDSRRASLDRLMKTLEAEKRHGEALDKMLKEMRGQNKIKDLNDLDLDELTELKTKLEALRDKIMSKVRDMEVSSTLLMLSKDKTPFNPEGLEMKKKSKNK